MKTASWLRRHWRWLIPLTVLAILCLVPEAAARAGGGGHFSGGGGGGGSGGSGGGGGGGAALYLVIRLVFAYPLVGVPVAILVIGGMAYASYVAKEQADLQIQGRGIRSGRQLADRMSREQGLAAIQQSDPAFDQARFLDRVGTAFVRLQDAWSAQDLNPVRHFVSDAVHERFSLQLAEMGQRGVRNIMENVSVESATIAQVDVEDQFQTITVLIQAVAADYELDAADKLVFGSKRPEEFSEYWSFIRRPGATSKAGEGLMEGHCPNCGAALQVNQSAQCEFCGAKLRSGQYDWVLTEITQVSEWRPDRAHDVPGLACITAADPAFSAQHLEDRASVMFWRYIGAWQDGTAAPLRKLARDEYCAILADEFRPDAQGVRIIPTEAAVGAVDTLGILCEEPLDRALLEVRWSCGQQQRLADGSRRPHAAASFRVSVFVLSRDHGVTGDADGALASAHCPNCGAPAVASTANACEYCDTVLNRGDRDWVLDGIYPRYDQTVTDLLARFQEERRPQPLAGGTELAAWMVYVMLADGEIDDKEEQLLRTFAAARGVGQPQLQQIIAAMKAGQLEVHLPTSSAQAREWLGVMAEMALADGFIAKQEQDAMLALGEHLDLTPYDVNHIIATTRKRLYQEGKARVRDLRRQS